MISDEIPEILHNCNRVLVMREGKLEAEIREAAGAQEADLLTAIAGKKGNEARA